MSKLISPTYLAFPFRVDKEGSIAETRQAHVRAQIEQVLFTNPRERVFRPEFGAGVRRLIFEPNNQSLWGATRRRLNSSLTQALHGEVDPKTIKVDLNSDGEKLLIRISYTLAAIGVHETYQAELRGRYG